MIDRRPKFDLCAFILVASVVGYPFVASITGTLGLDNTSYSIAFRGLVLAAAVVAIVRSPWQARSLRLGRIFYLFLFFWMIYILRITYDTQFYAYQLSQPASIYWAFGIGTCFIPALALAITPTKIDANHLFRAMLSIAVIALVLASFSADSQITNSFGNTYDTGRFQLEALNPIALGHLAVTVILLAYWRLRNSPAKVSEMIFFMFLIGLGLLGMALSSSRGPLAALIIAIIFIEMSKRGLFLFAFLVSFLVVLPLFAVDWTAMDRFLGTNTLGRLQTLFDGEDNSISIRMQLWSGAWQQFLDNPLIGSALEVRTFRFYPHNVFVESLMATGLLGGTAFSLLILGGLALGFRMSLAQDKYSWIAVLYCQYVVAAQFSGGLYMANSMWTLLGAIIMRAAWRSSVNNPVDRKYRLQAA